MREGRSEAQDTYTHPLSSRFLLASSGSRWRDDRHSSTTGKLSWMVALICLTGLEIQSRSILDLYIGLVHLAECVNLLRSMIRGLDWRVERVLSFSSLVPAK